MYISQQIDKEHRFSISEKRIQCLITLIEGFSQLFIFNKQFLKMSNYRKKIYEAHQQSRFHRRSSSQIYWVQSTSTLTTSSQQSVDLDYDQGNWCAEKMRQQRHKMEKLLLCYEQQRKCIGELEQYIDELEKANSTKDEEIKRLSLYKDYQNERNALQNNLQKQITKDQKVEKDRMISLINVQLKVYDMERQRWQKQLENKQQELIDERQSFEEQIEENHEFYKEKILKTELKWLAIQKGLKDQISKLQRQKIDLQEQNKTYKQQVSKKNQFEEILKLRRQLSKRQNQISYNTEKIQMDNQILRQEVQKLKAQLKKMKKQNCKLKNQLQTKMFDFQMEQKIASNLQAKRQKSMKRHQQLSEDKYRAQKLVQQLKKTKKDLQYYEKKCQDLSNTNNQLLIQIQRLNSFFTQRQQNQLKWHSLRKQEHQQIQHLNRLFKKIDFSI